MTGDSTNPAGTPWLGQLTPASTIAVREDYENGIAVIQVGQEVGNVIVQVITLAVPLHAAQQWGGSLLNIRPLHAAQQWGGSLLNIRPDTGR